MKHPILLVEDDENDVYFFERAFAKAALAHPLKVVRDGQEALDYLSGLGAYTDRVQHPLPCLVVLDLNLPRIQGLEVLRWLRQHEPTSTLLVIVLTSSTSDMDVHEAYSLGANSYLAKPGDPQQLTEIAQVIKTYWLGLNRIPKHPARKP